jgi:hypothetical protein
MRRSTMIVGFSVILVLAPAPAFAGYGALAYDEEAKKYGLSSDEVSQTKADDVATKECGSGKCKIIFRTASRECGAIAVAAEGNAWGGGKAAQKAKAELDAVNNCQKRTKGQCKVRETVCNR